MLPVEGLQLGQYFKTEPLQVRTYLQFFEFSWKGGGGDKCYNIYSVSVSVLNLSFIEINFTLEPTGISDL
jgi:hypothetical protein